MFDDFAARQLRSQAAKFVKDVRTIRRKGDKSETEIVVISRHSERQRKNPAYYCNTSKLKGIHMKNLTKTAHASSPLGLFASKNLAAKKAAFTLAEVLITLALSALLQL